MLLTPDEAEIEERGDLSQRLVMALGGNAFTMEGEPGEYSTQALHAEEMAGMLVEAMDAGWQVAIAHGNGPQVGNLSIQQENGAGLVPPQPLFSLVAMTQGQMGSMIACAVRNRTGGSRVVAGITTHVVVDAADPAMSNPTKPIGPFLTEDQARAMSAERGWEIREDSGRGYRRVVASPIPTGIVEIEAVRTLLDAGQLVVTVGGGGIPVLGDDAGRMQPVDAVVDKDYAAATLGAQIGADALLIVTAVDSVMLDFGKPTARPVHLMTVSEAEKYNEQGQFPAGSMGPKVTAACRFIRAGGRSAIITSPGSAGAALRAWPAVGDVGTMIVADDNSRPGTTSGSND